MRRRTTLVTLTTLSSGKSPFNFIPDGEGLFGGKDGVLYTDDGGCLQPDCPYVAYSGETGHPIRGKWPPGRSEATLGIS